MPFALTTVGLLFIIVGFQDTYKQFGAQVQSDFTGQGNFIYWMISLGIVGSLGYVKEFQTFSRVFMALLIAALFLSKKTGTAQGITFFSNLTSGVTAGTTSVVDPIGTALQSSASSSSTSSSGSDKLNNAIGGAVTNVLGF